jgi:hypothetical protein
MIICFEIYFINPIKKSNLINLKIIFLKNFHINLNIFKKFLNYLF